MDNRKKTKIYEYLFIAAVSVVTVLLFVFTALMPYGNEIILILANGLTLSSALVIILYRDRKKLFWRIFLIVYIVSAVFLAVYIPVEKYGFIEHLKNPDELRRIILSTGNFGIVVFFLINLASVIILPVPASLLVVVGALVYGPWKTFFISASATFAGSLCPSATIRISLGPAIISMATVPKTCFFASATKAFPGPTILSTRGTDSVP